MNPFRSQWKKSRRRIGRITSINLTFLTTRSGFTKSRDTKCEQGRKDQNMKATVIYGPRDVRVEDRGTPKIEKPTDAVIRISATCVCGSDLWAYRGLQPVNEPTPMGHEYCGIVEEIGSAVKSVKPGQFVVGSFACSDNTCPHCQA